MPLVRKAGEGDEEPEQDLQEHGATFVIDDGADGELAIFLPPLDRKDP